MWYMQGTNDKKCGFGDKKCGFDDKKCGKMIKNVVDMFFLFSLIYYCILYILYSLFFLKVFSK